MYGLEAIPPSRFSKHNANGLWEYSPLLCAAGLVEGLVLSQKISMFMWDRMTEPTLVIHLHNMLVQTGYIKDPIELYATFQRLLEQSFFPDGVPTSDFYGALIKQLQVRNDPSLLRKRRAHHIMDIDANHFFKTKSALVMYHDAAWVPEDIPESEIRFPSVLAMVRLSETEKVLDPITGKERLKETELVRRAKAKGFTDAQLMEQVSYIADDDDKDTSDGATAAATARLAAQEGHEKYDVLPDRRFIPYVKKMGFATGKIVLHLLRMDLFADVCGRCPLSSINFPWITAILMMLFTRIEDRLRESRNPLYVQTYEKAPPSMRRARRAALIMAAIREDDDDVLKVCAEILQNPRLGILDFVFWGKLRDWSDIGTTREAHRDILSSNTCSLM